MRLSVKQLLFLIFFVSWNAAYSQISNERAQALMSLVFDEYKAETSLLPYPFVWEYWGQEKGTRPAFGYWSSARAGEKIVEKDGIASSILFVQIVRDEIIDREMTEDAFLVTVCHELGHLLGGAPYHGQKIYKYRAFSSEDQADKFSASKCLKRVFPKIPAIEDEQAKQLVSGVSEFCSSSSDPSLCGRIVLAGYRRWIMVRSVTRQPVNLEVIAKRKSRLFIEGSAVHSDKLDRLQIVMNGAVCNADPYDNNYCQ